MDIATQAILGAAAGEAVLGKKIGNRAMLYGVVAGILPDLDVVALPFISQVERLSAHRGISHSVFFLTAVAFSFPGCFTGIKEHLTLASNAGFASFCWPCFLMYCWMPLLDMALCFFCPSAMPELVLTASLLWTRFTQFRY